CFAAGIDPPRMVFGHGFVYRKDEKTGELFPESKSRGHVTEPMDIITQFSAEAFRYYFLRKCPFPADGEFSWDEFRRTYNADLANTLGTLYSGVVGLIGKNYDGVLEGPAHVEPGTIYRETDPETPVQQVQAHIEACQYNQALDRIWLQVLNPTNQY